MKVNESMMERVARVVAGLTILKAGKSRGSKMGLLGLVPLVTGATGHCPMKSMMFGDKRQSKTYSDNRDSRPLDKASEKTAEKMDEATPA